MDEENPDFNLPNPDEYQSESEAEEVPESEAEAEHEEAAKSSLDLGMSPPIYILQTSLIFILI